MRKIVRRIAKPAPPAPAVQPPPVTPAPQAAPAPIPAPAPAPAPVPAPVSTEWTATRLPSPSGKKLLSLRLDADLITWFQQGGRGYQTRMNAVLRAWMEAQTRRS